MLQILIAIFIVFTVVRVVWFFLGRHMTPGLMYRNKYKFLVVLGSGGHTSEMLIMLKQFKDHLDRIDFSFIVAESDTTSIPRITVVLGEDFPYTVIRTPRIRHVGESFMTAIIRSPLILLHGILVVSRADPDVLITNGPGTCVPIILGACVVQIFSIAFKRIFCVFVESFCRVKTISLSGKVVYPFVDKFILQWPPTQEIAKKYPNAVYRGKLL